MRWMPKSYKLYYTVTALSGNDVITLDPATLNEETLLKGIPEQSFTWSPNILVQASLYYGTESLNGLLRQQNNPQKHLNQEAGSW